MSVFLDVAVSNTFIDNVVKWSSENSYLPKLLLDMHQYSSNYFRLKGFSV